ncbi:uncharacterized, partial [Tachysurus ichikawai]
LSMVFGLVIFIGVGEQEELRVRVNGEVSLDDGLVLADEVCYVLHLDLRLNRRSTVSITAGITGGS